MLRKIKGGAGWCAVHTPAPPSRSMPPSVGWVELAQCRTDAPAPELDFARRRWLLTQSGGGGRLTVRKILNLHFKKGQKWAKWTKGEERQVLPAGVWVQERSSQELDPSGLWGLGTEARRVPCAFFLTFRLWRGSGLGFLRGIVLDVPPKRLSCPDTGAGQKGNPESGPLSPAHPGWPLAAGFPPEHRWRQGLPMLLLPGTEPWH